ncbi:MAG: lactonase family protein [Casimicrobiaceae bacterium]|nr:lactonase family protein [Casimicrobiaceae bacterium]MDW8312010.1 beta-propeller fold lactonase family protein [Burkholderiales bacterium]
MRARALVVSHAESATLWLLAISANGHLRHADTACGHGVLMPIVRHPNAPWVYVARRSEPFAVVRFLVDLEAWRLKRLDEAPLPASMPYLAIDRAGRWLLAASFSSHLLAALPIGPDGAVGPVRHTVPTAANAHAVVLSHHERFVLVPCLGGNRIERFAFDTHSAELTRIEPPWIAAGNVGPRHACLNRRGDRLYVLHELAGQIEVLRFDPADGTLESLSFAAMAMPAGAGAPWAAELRLSPDERWLFASERRTSTLHVFSVEDNGDTLRWRAATSTERQPRGFALDFDGKTLWVAGERSGHLTRYEVAANGHLCATQRIALDRGPNWVLPLA